VIILFQLQENKHVSLAARPASSFVSPGLASSGSGRRYLSACIGLASLALLPSCIPVIVAGGATGGYVAGQERGVNDTASDTRIRAQINDLWFKYDTDMVQQLSLSVYEGRVLITGAVSNPDWKVEAVRLVWQVDGVKEVNSEIELADKSSIMDGARDKLITTRLRSAILFDSKVRSVNYTIDTVNGVVYLTGSGRTQGELDLVTDYARNIPNVKRVVSYVRIRPGEPSTPVADTNATPAAAQPAPVSTPAPSAAPQAVGSPAPLTNGSGPAKIEVQPLQ
jgi:osmotically-inducible protein OsmY